MAVRIRLDDAEARRGLRRLDRELRGRIRTRALNRTLTGLRTDVDRTIRGTLNLKARDVRKDIRVRRARPGGDEASVVVAGRAAPLSRFGARQTRRGVSVKVRKGGARVRFRHAFLVKFASGRLAAVERRGIGRLPIDQLFSTAPVQLLDDEQIIRRLGARALDRYARELDHEIERRLQA